MAIAAALVRFPHDPSILAGIGQLLDGQRRSSELRALLADEERLAAAAELLVLQRTTSAIEADLAALRLVAAADGILSSRAAWLP